MKVIALRSTPNTGKSHTINIVYSLLINIGYRQVPGFFREMGRSKDEDVFDILENDKIKLGIIGMGDYVRKPGICLKDLLLEQEKNGCDVVICPCRVNKIMESDVSAYNVHHFVDKTITNQKSLIKIVNTQDAIKIITLI